MGDKESRLGLRERKKAKLRKQIVQTALELFRTRGYHGTRVADIVEALEISQPTFFRYFPSKDAVLRHALKVMASRLVAQVEPELSNERQRAPALESYLSHFVDLVAKAVEANKELTRAMGVSGILVPIGTKRNDGAGYPRRKPGTLVHFFALARERGEVRSDIAPEEMAHCFTGMYGHIVMYWAGTDEPPYDLRQRLTSALRVFLGGVRAVEPEGEAGRS